MLYLVERTNIDFKSMIGLIGLIIIFLFFLGIPLVQGYREKTKEIQLEKENNAREFRIRKFMEEYRKILSSEPTKPHNFSTIILDKTYLKSNDKWSIWYKAKIEFEGSRSLSEQKEKGTAVRRIQEQINPPIKRREKDLLERVRGISFKSYSTFQIIVKELNEGKISFSENIEDWEKTIIQLTKALKILKSIEFSFYKNRNEFNILYKSKILFSPTTIKFEYDKNTYTIIVNTGLAFNGRETEISNRPIAFKDIEEQYKLIIDKMEKALPKSRFDSILEKIKALAQSQE